MSSYLRLIVESTKTHPDILALHGCCDALAQRSLSHSWRAIEAEDRRLEVASQTQHSHIFKYALLHLLKSVVVAVEYLLGAFQVKVIL